MVVIRFADVTTGYIQLYKLWLGAAEYLFRQSELLEECIELTLNDGTFRSDDLEFIIAARVSVAWGTRERY